MSVQIFDPKYECKVDGCDRQRQSRGWCPAHYNQWRTTGETPSRPFTVAGRFSKFVPKAGPDECWEWQSNRNNSGYGKFWLDGKTAAAHRVAYRLYKGLIPDGLIVRHTCDNPPCVNPSHLLLGDAFDNARDELDRGRYPRGESQGRSKLKVDEVTAIRRGWAEGMTQVEMARQYGVSKSAIYWILCGRSWIGLGEEA